MCVSSNVIQYTYVDFGYRLKERSFQTRPEACRPTSTMLTSQFLSLYIYIHIQCIYENAREVLLTMYISEVLRYCPAVDVYGK